MPLTACKKTLLYLSFAFLSFLHISTITGTIYILIELHKFKTFIFYNSLLPVILILFIKLIQLFAFWHGVSGLKKEDKRNVFKFCCTLVIIIIFDILIGIWAFVERDNIHESIRVNMEVSFKDYITKQYGKEWWNNLQNQSKCCGVDGLVSYTESTDIIPISCCDLNKTNLACEGEFYKIGCYKAVLIYTREYLFYFIVLNYVYVILQVLGLSIFCQFYSILQKISKPKRIERAAERRPLSIHR